MAASVTKHSRQREAILNYLRSTRSHPTADDVYQNIHKEIPNISLGTVYRNLNFLVDNGKILKLSVGVGPDHFDGFTHPHYHFICNECGRVQDIDLPVIEQEHFEKSITGFNGRVDDYQLTFYGVCEDCLKEEN